jgi:hypothetical protein
MVMSQRNRSRRTPRRVSREVPLWQRRRRTSRRRPERPSDQPVYQLSGRHAAKIAEAAATAAAVAAAQAGLLAAKDPARSVVPIGPSKRAWRFRRHVPPFAWLVLLLGAGAGLHVAPDVFWWGLLASVVVPAGMLLVTGQRRKDKSWIFSLWVRRFTGAQAGATSFWLNMLGWLGVRVCGPFVLLSGGVFLGLWVRHYRWRPAAAPVREPAPAADVPDEDAATFAALARAQKWSATLGDREDLPAGGRRYPVQCDGINTVMPKILGAPAFVAGAYHRPATEVYAERDPLGVPSRGSLTILSGNSLVAGRAWAGAGMDLKTGLAVSGRFADGRDSHDKWYEPRYGCYHDLDAGTTGSGKSERLNLKVFTALATGWFVPVILDPQEGQSLPFWQDKCMYARGDAEVERYIRGLHAGFLDRSSYLASYRWNDDGVDMPGMPFFDYELLGGALKIVLVILDEAHLVLKDDTKRQRQITRYVVELARLIRKAGGKMVLATQTPGLSDLGGSQALRDMLRGGNVWSGRTANSVGQGQLGLVKDPSDIPRYFADGSKTSGLAYTDGPDVRPDAPQRGDFVGREHYLSPPAVPVLDDRFLEVMDKVMKVAVSPSSTVAPVTGDPAPVSGGGLLTLVRPARVEDDEADDAPEGRQCADAVWKVLSDDGGPLSRGVIIERIGVLSEAWGRAKPWTVKAIGNACGKLAEGGVPGRPVTKSGNGVYQAHP